MKVGDMCVKKPQGEMFLNFKAEILKEKPKNYEMAGLNDLDIMFIKGVAIHEGVNENGALAERDDLNKAKGTFVGKPLRIRFLNNNPTGHGYDPKTGNFDELVKNIGYIYDAEGILFKDDGTQEYVWGDSIPEGGTYKIVVYIAMWQKYYPTIALRLRQLHDEDNLNFSIEATRDYEITQEGYRKCFNIMFNGLAVVSDPAWTESNSLMVAEILNKKKEETKMDFEKMYNTLLAENTSISTKLALAEVDRDKYKNELATANGELEKLKIESAEKDGEIKTITAERDGYKTTVETAEKAKLGDERHAKLAKYGEVKATHEELASKTPAEFIVMLETAVTGFDPSSKEHAEYMAHQENVSTADKSGRKGKLLDLCLGLGK